MATKIGSAVGDWVRRLRVQPGQLARDHPGRGVGDLLRRCRASSPSAASGATTSEEKAERKELPKGKGTKKEPVLSDVDPEMAEIEALLRKRGIT